jgi:hypothetical protein
MSEPVTARAFEIPESVDRFRQRAGLVGLVALALGVVGALLDPPVFFQAYLVAFIFWTGLSLGCLALMMIHHLSGGQWGLVIRRLLEAGVRVLPVMAVLFLPLIFGLSHIYLWAQPEVVARDPYLLHKQPFLNVPFWVVRTLIYFAIWTTMGLLLTRWSAEQDRAGVHPIDPRFGRLSGPGLVVYGLTVSLASVDWMMSVDPHWFSTIYGFVMMGGQALSALAFVIIATFLLMPVRPLAGVVRTSHVHDLGKLMFAFVMLYAYLIFSQFLIIWMANLPDEIMWYIRRFTGGWQYAIVFLVFFHFAAPFAILLSADVKRHAKWLTSIAVLLFGMRIFEIFYQVMPQFRPAFFVHWIDLAVVIGMGGVWLAAFAHFLRARPMLPVNDPYFREVLATHGTH